MRQYSDDLFLRLETGKKKNEKITSFEIRIVYKFNLMVFFFLISEVLHSTAINQSKKYGPAMVKLKTKSVISRRVIININNIFRAFHYDAKYRIISALSFQSEVDKKLR